jgi:UDP-glucose 4-epimerase
MSKVLITGVAGLLGTHLSRHLLNQGHEVIGIDNFSGGYRDFVDPNVDLYVTDLDDADAVAGVFNMAKPDYVYHFAAYAAEGLSPFIRNFNYTNNVLCSINVVNECLKHDVKKLIFTSSMAVYGVGHPPFTEDQQPAPVDPYGIAKYTVEQDIKQANNQFGLNFTLVRPHNVVGIYQNIWDRYRNVIGIWIRQILNGQSITIFGDGTQKRAFSDICFYMDPFTRLMEEYNGETFNIGADQEYRIIDAANLLNNVAKKYGFSSSINHLEPRHEVKDAFSDHTKAKRLLSFVDGTDLEKVMNDMFVWAKDQPERTVKTIPYEVEKGMYSFWK